MMNRYRRYFQKVRHSLNHEQCTYARGKVDGRQEAHRKRDMEGKMPEFCDRDLFRVYYDGYKSGWQEGKNQLCRIDKAFDDGLQAAQSGRRAPSLHYNCSNQERRSYQRQYDRGFRSAKNQGMPPSRSLKDAIASTSTTAAPKILKRRQTRTGANIEDILLWLNGTPLLTQSRGHQEGHSIFIPMARN